MNEKMRSHVMGLIMGQFSSPLPISQKEPVAYLYNGVRLPKLPEWDREMYPYAAVSASGHTSYYLRLLPPDATYQIYNNKWVLMGNNTLTSNHSDPTGWGNFFESGSAYISVRNRDSIGIGTVWTDFNLLNQNGTVFMAASEPIPVYE